MPGTVYSFAGGTSWSWHFSSLCFLIHRKAEEFSFSERTFSQGIYFQSQNFQIYSLIIAAESILRRPYRSRKTSSYPQRYDGFDESFGAQFDRRLFISFFSALRPVCSCHMSGTVPETSKQHCECNPSIQVEFRGV